MLILFRGYLFASFLWCNIKIPCVKYTHDEDDKNYVNFGNNSRSFLEVVVRKNKEFYLVANVSINYTVNEK